jgi:predicted HAD superfamily Cof-like phosphohydrolase
VGVPGKLLARRDPRTPTKGRSVTSVALSPKEYVRHFHKAFDAPIRTAPAAIDSREAFLRSNLIAEELNELDDGIEKMLEAEGSEDELDALTEIADALADLTYVVYGAALTFGIPIDAVIAEVHRSNMSKLGADGKPVLRDDGKIMKGPNYTPPDVRSIIKTALEREQRRAA